MKKYEKLVSIVIVTHNRIKELQECLYSSLRSTYSPIEIIIVDNDSHPKVSDIILRRKGEIKIVTNAENLGAAEGRNIGLRNSLGEYILFMDDDAVADKNMIYALVRAFKKNKDAGIIQPLIYDKDNTKMLQGAGHDINLLTGRITANGVREIDNGQYNGIREIPMAGCIWMVKREVFDKIGDYDEEYFIPYEDSDFSIRARKANFKIYSQSEAKAWHQGKKITYIHPFVEWIGITSPERAFRVARNKMIFIRKNSPAINQFLFFFIFMPFYTFIHSILIISSARFDILRKYWSGVFSGIKYAIFYSRNTKFKNFNLNTVNLILLAWTDPLAWIIDKSSETIVDLACGEGKPMQMLKIRMNVKRSLGVDLFKPYIEKASGNKIHDEYILQDIRNVKLKPKSFDIALASHVLEHLSKEEAWKVLEKMEKTAKKQVIIATPVGELYQPAVKGNKLEEHHTFFLPREFEERGYKTIRYGWRWLLDEHSEGLIHRVSNPYVKKMLYLFNFLVTPLYYLFQNTCDYSFVAYKKIS